MDAASEKVVTMISQSGLISGDHAHDIVSAFNHVKANTRVGFVIAACLAMVQNESGGRMIWGADPGGDALPAYLREQPVTYWNYQEYKARRNQGMTPQGCGITQLTSTGLQVEAEKAGGCWVPFYNCVVGFHFLHDLFVTHGSALAGFTAYNGSGPAAEAYGQRAVALTAEWQSRVSAALR